MEYNLTVYNDKGDIMKILRTEDPELVALHTEGLDPSSYKLTEEEND